jgi:hypothetical protein
MDYFEFFKEAYKNESDRRAQLSSLLPIPIGIFTVVGGGFYAMAQGLHPPLNGWQIACAGLLVVAVLLGAVAAYNLVRFQFGHKYRYLPFSDEIEDFRRRSAGYYERAGQPPTAADDDVKTKLRDDYISFSSFNARVNDRKTRLLYITNSYLAACALVVLAASVSFSIAQMSSNQPEGSRTLTIDLSYSSLGGQGACHARRREREAAAGPQAHRGR